MPEPFQGITNLKDYLIEQAQIHPSVRPQDMIKLCRQAAFGAEPVRDEADAKQLFMKEFTAASGPSRLYEKISPGCCRVNLSAWKERGLPPEWLFRMYVSSAAMPSNADAAFQAFLQETDQLCAQGAMPFCYEDWKDAWNAYRNAGGGTICHSDAYKKSERPSYRLVCARFLRLFPLFERIAKQKPKNDAFVIAMDGRSASGKTTMAAQLSQILNAGVIHMDDFFLPVSLRTQARLAAPGGNVHYERFAQEVLPKMIRAEAFSYRRFDCLQMDFGNPREVCASTWRVVEGAYSSHPYFHDYADIRVFSDVEPKEQLRRITLRNGAEAAEVFAKRWIPMEEHYFNEFHIAERADLIL